MLQDATRFLLSVTIPEFARQLCRLLAEESRLSADGSISQFRLTEALHRSGINLCFLGKLHENSLLNKVRALFFASFASFSSFFPP